MPKNAPKPATAGKARPESLQAALRTPENRDALFNVVEGGTLQEAQAWLWETLKIRRSLDAISSWAQSERTERAFADQLAKLRSNQERAASIAQEVGDAFDIAKANVALLGQALLDAQLAGDEAAKAKAAQLMFFALSSIAKNKQADAQMLAARTAHNKFQFDAAKAALAAAADLQEIARSAGSEREKVQRAVDRLFGERPETVEAVSAE